MRFAELAERVRADIGQQHRYAHCVRVARLAEKLALEHGQDTRKARLAGMLHDLARLYAPQRLIDECNARGIAIGAFEREHPTVLHAAVSAALARERYGVTDERILSAIAKHTLGAAQMSPLDCILYLADSLEPGRKFDGRAALEELASLDLAAAMRATIRSTMRYLTNRHLPLAPQTAQAMQFFGPEAGTMEATTGGHY